MSCGLHLISSEGSTVFKCPDCQQTLIGRCSQCRDQSVTYKCPSCGFQGP